MTCLAEACCSDSAVKKSSNRPGVAQDGSIGIATKRAWTTPRLFSISMKFLPYFVENYFLRWHTSNNLASYDKISLHIDVVIWLVCVLVVEPFSWMQLFTMLCLAAAMLIAAVQAAYPASYVKHRTAITTARRLMTVPNIRYGHLTRKFYATASWRAVVWHMIVQPGGFHNLLANLFYVENWRKAAVDSIITLIVLGPLTKLACSQLLSSPLADISLWRHLAAGFDRATAGVFRQALQEQHMSEAVCRTTATTIQVLLPCVGICASYCIEWWYRLRFKQQQLPASVAAMQSHVYRRMWCVVVAEMMLLVLYPCAVVTWLLAGSWNGLWSC